MEMGHFLLVSLAVAASATPSCVVIRDAASGQDVKIEASGANGVRVRAVPSGNRSVHFVIVCTL